MRTVSCSQSCSASIAGLLQAQVGRFSQPLRAQLSQVDGGSQGEQALVGADVAGRLFAADMLLASLQREHEAAFAAAVDRLADDPARHAADELLAAGHDAQVGAAVGQGRAERLPFGHGDVGPVVARALQQAQADRIEHGDEQRAPRRGRPRQSHRHLRCSRRSWAAAARRRPFGRRRAAARSAGATDALGVGDRDQFGIEVLQIGRDRLADTRDGANRARRHGRSGGVQLMAISTASAAALPPS